MTPPSRSRLISIVNATVAGRYFSLGMENIIFSSETRCAALNLAAAAHAIRSMCLFGRSLGCDNFIHLKIFFFCHSLEWRLILG